MHIILLNSIMVMHRYFTNVITLYSLLHKYTNTQSLSFLFIYQHFLDHYHHLREPIREIKKRRESEIVKVISSAHLIMLLIARLDLHDC